MISGKYPLFCRKDEIVASCHIFNCTEFGIIKIGIEEKRVRAQCHQWCQNFYDTKSIKSRYIILVFNDGLESTRKASFSRFSSEYKKTETVLLVKIYRFGPVVGIDNHKATTSFVIRVDKPGNQVINDLTPQVQAAALELAVNSQSSNQERRIRTRMLCIGHLAFQAVPRRLGNHCRFDAVMHRSERNRLNPHRRSRTRTGRYSCRWGKGCNQMLNGFFPLWASL